MASTAGALPPFYSLPPFFTLQPVAESRQKQMEMWAEVLLAWCKSSRTFLVDSSTAIFHNKDINRRLPTAGVTAVLEHMSSCKQAEWTDPKAKSQSLILWMSLSDWGQELMKWAGSQAKKGTVCTLFEIMEGDDTKGTPLHQIPQQLLLRIVQVLDEQDKAKPVTSSSTGDVEGVKFL